jgi:hypothetical protein
MRNRRWWWYKGLSTAGYAQHHVLFERCAGNGDHTDQRIWLRRGRNSPTHGPVTPCKCRDSAEDQGSHTQR